VSGADACDGPSTKFRIRDTKLGQEDASCDIIAGNEGRPYFDEQLGSRWLSSEQQVPISSEKRMLVAFGECRELSTELVPRNVRMNA
jgi:hypothetical protein